MTENDPEDESPHDDAEQPYNSDAAAAIARARLADELDVSEYGAADDLADALTEVANDLRTGDLTVHRLDYACVHLELVQNVLRDVSRLHGWGWETDSDDHAQPEPDIEPGADE